LSYYIRTTTGSKALRNFFFFNYFFSKRKRKRKRALQQKKKKNEKKKFQEKALKSEEQLCAPAKEKNNFGRKYNSCKTGKEVFYAEKQMIILATQQCTIKMNCNLHHFEDLTM
jgi:hypothetical protein